MKKHAWIALALANGSNNSAHATESAPLWEAGAGIAALTLPAYRGSDVTHNYVLPVPYLVYHGDFLKADKRGVRGQLFENDRLDLNISVSASPPTDDDVPQREGMPDLKPTVEFGPELDITLWDGNADIAFLKLRLPVRQAFTVEKNPQNAGIIFSPNLNADIRNPFGLTGWTLGVVAGPIFATERQHAYFYGVDSRYATATRPAYEADGGYSGTQLLLSLSKRFNKLWLGAYVREDTLRGAVFADSPLVARDQYFSRAWPCRG
ncbi:conserved hypothetical protein, partial [Ricinus communis]